MHLLDFPLEILRQILYDALMCEIEERQPYPFGRRSLPYDRPLNPFFVLEELAILEQLVWIQSSFWGREPMSRFMRVNRLFHAEVYKILWSEFSLFTAGLKPNHYWNTVHWLANHNPRALNTVKHLHVSWQLLVDAKTRENYSEEKEALCLYLGSFSRLLTVRFQIAIHRPYMHLEGKARSELSRIEESKEAKDFAVSQTLQIVSLCGELDVKISWVPDPRWLEGKKIIDRCIEILGQDAALPRLHQKHLRSWPARYAYVRPEFESHENSYDCPSPRFGAHRCEDFPRWPLENWPEIRPKDPNIYRW